MTNTTGNHIPWMAAALMLTGILLAGCEKIKMIPFAPEGKEFAINIPSGWYYTPDVKSLKPMAEDLSRKLKGSKIQLSPLLMISSPKGEIKALVSQPITTLPLAGNPMREYITEMAKLINMPLGTYSNTNNIISFTSETSLTNGVFVLKKLVQKENRIYAFVGRTYGPHPENNVEILKTLFNSISFDPKTINHAFNTYQKSSSGFITGLWHGLLLPFRLISDIFSDVQIISKHNSGWSYWLGYALGLAALIMILIPKRAHPLPDDHSGGASDPRQQTPTE